MSETVAAPPRFRVPIAVQILLLLAFGLVAAQLTTLALTLFVPYRPPALELEDVARALGGAEVKPVGGRALIRTIETAPPNPQGNDWIVPGRHKRDLAGLLVKSGRDVRLYFHFPPPLGGAPIAPDRPFGRDPHVHEGPDGPPARGPPPAERAEPSDNPGPPGSNTQFRDQEEPPHGLHVRGEFIAAERLSPGRWAVVKPSPEGFPSAWQRRMLLWFALSFAVIAPLGYLFARRLVSPITAFAEAAERLGRDPRAPPLQLSGPAEIGRAARAFNQMQVRLKRYVEDRTGMIGAISHDLRTPLARLRFKLESAPEAVRASMLEDVTQMEAMITAVLTFIRDAAEPAARERTDLRSIVECVVDDAALVGADVTLDSGDPVMVAVDSLAVQRVVGNLVDNAVKYGGKAEVRLQQTPGEAWVEVRDPGPGLSSEDRERVFQPFYRTEKARTLDVGGVGLGLSISRSIARAHGGDVEIASAPPGTLARLRLPLPTPGRARATG